MNNKKLGIIIGIICITIGAWLLFNNTYTTNIGEGDVSTTIFLSIRPDNQSLITMIIAPITILLGILFIVLKNKVRYINSIKTYEKITAKLDIFLWRLPIFAVIFFSVLFVTVLQRRIMERSSHAFILVFLWVIATSFYIEIMRHYNNKAIVITSIIGCIISAGLAITLTPLDRYSIFVYSNLNICSFILGGYLMIIFYSSYLLKKTNSKI